ncbi:MAG: hypothetical protein ACHQ9S_18920 [Candidatus Binatia bacterium]
MSIHYSAFHCRMSGGGGERGSSTGKLRCHVTWQEGVRLSRRTTTLKSSQAPHTTVYNTVGRHSAALFEGEYLYRACGRRAILER